MSMENTVPYHYEIVDVQPVSLEEVDSFILSDPEQRFGPAASWNLTRNADTTARISADAIMQLHFGLKQLHVGDVPYWMIAPKTYNRLRYYSHLGRCRSLPRRKLRKCYLRKIDRFLKRERKRYHL